MTKLLNLDDLPTAEKTIVLNGKRHAMQPMSVGKFIEQQKAARAVEKKVNGDDAVAGVERAIELMIGIVADVFPTIERKELEALSFEKLNAIFQFINAENEPKEGETKAGE